MERLNKKPISPVDKLIKKLEALIVQDKVTQQQLDGIQEAVDKIDAGLDEPNYQLFELQSIIYYARNDKSESLGYIEDALSLNSNVSDYSKIGALIAEIFIERSRVDDQNEGTIKDSSNYNKATDELEDNEHIEHDKLVKQLRKKYSGKLEGWLALYSLRLVFIPIVYIFDMASVLGDDISSYTDDFKSFLYAAISIDAIIVLCSIVLWYFYFKKKQTAIFYARLLEVILVIYHVAIGLWLNSLYQQYSIPVDSELTKLPLYGVVAFLWTMYWYKSKRVVATFVN